MTEPTQTLGVLQEWVLQLFIPWFPFGDEYETIHLKLICEDLLAPLSISQYPATLFVAS